jgi:hypothetical protein
VTTSPGPPRVIGAVLSVLVQETTTTAIAPMLDKRKQSCRIGKRPSTMAAVC